MSVAYDEEDAGLVILALEIAKDFDELSTQNNFDPEDSFAGKLSESGLGHHPEAYYRPSYHAPPYAQHPMFALLRAKSRSLSYSEDFSHKASTFMHLTHHLSQNHPPPPPLHPTPPHHPSDDPMEKFTIISLSDADSLRFVPPIPKSKSKPTATQQKPKHRVPKINVNITQPISASTKQTSYGSQLTALEFQVNNSFSPVSMITPPSASLHTPQLSLTAYSASNKAATLYSMHSPPPTHRYNNSASNPQQNSIQNNPHISKTQKVEKPKKVDKIDKSPCLSPRTQQKRLKKRSSLLQLSDNKSSQSSGKPRRGRHGKYRSDELNQRRVSKDFYRSRCRTPQPSHSDGLKKKKCQSEASQPAFHFEQFNVPPALMDIESPKQPAPYFVKRKPLGELELVGDKREEDKVRALQEPVCGNGSRRRGRHKKQSGSNGFFFSGRSLPRLRLKTKKKKAAVAVAASVRSVGNEETRKRNRANSTVHFIV